MSSSALPPPGNLPSWSRVSTLDRSRYPRPCIRDRIPATDTAVDVRFLEKMSQSVQHRFLNQDKSIKFLQEQHSKTLQKLHQELESLKRENKDLKFRFIVTQSSATPPHSPHDPRCQSVPSDIKSIILEEEIKDLKQALSASTLKNAELRKTVVYLESQIDTKDAEEDDGLSSQSSTPRKNRRKYSVSNRNVPLPFNATLNPLRVRDTADKSFRSPSLDECEQIIQHLHKANCFQLEELIRLRGDRASVASSRNATPEPQTVKSSEALTSGVKFPRIPSKPKSKKPMRGTHLSEFGEPLPMVVNSLSANLADVKRRQNRIPHKPSAPSNFSSHK